MRKLQFENASAACSAIQQEIARSDESRYDHRLHSVYLVASGHSCGEVARLLDDNVRTIQRWVKRFEQRGFQGLREGERPGRPRSLEASQWNTLARDLRRNPREFGLAQNLWDGKILREHIKMRFGITLGIRQCQRAFGQIGIRMDEIRSQVVQSDQGRAAAKKKPVSPRKAQ